MWLGAIAVACFTIPTSAFSSDLFSCTYLKIAQPRASKRAAMRAKDLGTNKTTPSSIPGWTDDADDGLQGVTSLLCLFCSTHQKGIA